MLEPVMPEGPVRGLAPPLQGPAGWARTVSLQDISAFLRASRLLIAMAVLLGLGGAGLYLHWATSLYTARAQLLLDPHSARQFHGGADRDDTLDTAAVDSQVTVLRSSRMAARVADDLGLDANPLFRPVPSRRRRLEAWAATQPALNWLGARAPARWVPWDEALSVLPGLSAGGKVPDQRQATLAALDRALDVRRLGLSDVIEVQVTLPDPALAAQIANAITAAYLRDQLDMRAEAARSGGDWLERRLAELKTQMQTANRAVEDFKQAHNIVDLGQRGPIDEQQISELNTQLVAARAHTAQAQARLQRVTEVLASDVPDAGVVEALGSATITDLRRRYVDAATRKADIETRFGPGAPATAAVVQEMKGYGAAMHDEMVRIGGTYRSDFEIAQSQQAALEADLGRLTQGTMASRREQSELAELTTNAGTYQRIYESYLQQFTEAVQQQSFPIPDARIILDASEPEVRSSPQSTLVLAFGGLVGMVAGVGLSLVRRGLDRAVRWPEQLRQEVGLDCLGLVPLIRRRHDPWAHAKRYGLDGRRSRWGAATRGGPPLLPSDANGLRGVKASITFSGHLSRMRCVGLTSALPGEGKSTVVGHLARLFAASGTRTLLIDADAHRRSLTRSLSFDGLPGLINVLARTATLEEAVVQSVVEDLDIMPVGRESGPRQAASDLLASPQMARLLEQARESYDMVLVDLAPMLPVVDARAMSPFLDGVVLVIEWGRTPVHAVMAVLGGLMSARARVLGAVLNKVSSGALRERQGGYLSYY